MKQDLFNQTFCFALVFILTGQITFAQSKTGRPDTSKSYIYYAFSGLGSNMGSMQPKIVINGTKLVYTYSQNSYYVKRTRKDENICTTTLRQSSIDSILNLVVNLKDTLIFKTNPCIMSGGIHFLTVAKDIDTTRFELGNTSEETALKIINIINKYLPDKKQLWQNEDLIKAEKDCWKWLFEEGKKREDSLKSPTKNKDGA